MVDIICTNCGGPIELSESGTYGVCPYCNSEFLLEDDELLKVEKYTTEIGGKSSFRKMFPHHHKQYIKNSHERLTTYYYKRMSEEDSEKYILYQSKTKVRNVMLEAVFVILGCLWFAIETPLVTTSGWGWIAIIALMVIIFDVAFREIPRLYFRKEDMKNATGYCEYTFAVLKCEEKMKFVCSDGQKLIYNVETESWEEFDEGQEVVLIRIPSIGKTFVESPKKMEKMFGVYM